MLLFVVKLQQLFQYIPEHVGFDVEIKYPSDEAYLAYLGLADRNTYVDTILKAQIQY